MLTHRLTRGLSSSIALVGVAVALAGCGGSGGPGVPTIAPAKVFSLDAFSPDSTVEPGKPVTIAFHVQQPSGATLTSYREGAGPHTGVHLIIVSDDLSSIIHQHPPVGADGSISQSVVFPKPGAYHVLVDIYPQVAGAPRNLQLTKTIDVKGTVTRVPIPPFKSVQTDDGYRFDVEGIPRLKAVEPSFLTVKVTDPAGKPAKFEQYYGALAHAIFFRTKTLEYFHTHVCSPGSSLCSGFAAAPTGTPTAPGVLKVGVLMPIGGVWRLFLQVKVGGRVVTAPYTLHVGA